MIKKCLFFGSDNVSTCAMRSLLKNRQNISLSAVAPPYSRPKTPLAEFHKLLDENQINLEYEFPSTKVDSAQKLENWTKLGNTITEKEFDIGVIASFGHMIPDHIIESFTRRTMLVMHPSLLPLYRGACPIQHAILNGDSKTGVSIIEISKGKFDAGKILWQKEMELEPTHTFDVVSK